MKAVSKIVIYLSIWCLLAIVSSSVFNRNPHTEAVKEVAREVSYIYANEGAFPESLEGLSHERRLLVTQYDIAIDEEKVYSSTGDYGE